MRIRNWILFLVMALLWGSSWSATKTALGFAPPFSFASQQFLLSALALSPLLIAFRGHVPRDRKTMGRVVIFALISTLNIAVVNFGLVYESSGTGAVLTFTQPLIVFGLSVLFLKEEVKALKLLGVVVGFLGVSTLSAKGAGSLLPTSYTSLLMILGAFLWALATVYYKKYLGQVNVMVTNALQFPVGFLLLFALSKGIEGFVFPLNNVYLGLLVFMALGATVLGTTIWLFLLSQEDPTSLSTYGFIIPIIALIFGWALLGERVDERTFLGSALIIVGVYLVQKEWPKKKVSVDVRTKL